MTKKILKTISLFLLITNTHTLFSESQSSLEIRSAAFFPSSKLFREIYGNVGVCYQLEGSTRLCKCIDGWANFDWFNRHGESYKLEDPTKVRIANTSIGVKFLCRSYKQLTPYVGIGPNLSKIWLQNKSEYFQESLSKWTIGCVFKSGVYLCINKSTYLNLFVDYLLQPVHFNTNVNIGGFNLGAGLGMKF